MISETSGASARLGNGRGASAGRNWGPGALLEGLPPVFAGGFPRGCAVGVFGLLVPCTVTVSACWAVAWEAQAGLINPLRLPEE